MTGRGHMQAGRTCSWKGPKDICEGRGTGKKDPILQYSPEKSAMGPPKHRPPLRRAQCQA